jgi:MFS family permease
MSTTLPPPVTNVTERDVKYATWICFFAWTFAVYDFVLFGNLLPKLAEDLGWSSSRATNVNTWVTIGTALVAFGIGPIIDRIGRRRGIVVAILGAAIASVLTAVAGWLAGVVAGVGIVALILVRSVAGLGYAEQAVNAAYLSEMFAHTHNDPVKARRRGQIYSLVQSGWPVGSVIAAGSIYLLFPIGGWALCFVVAAIPSVIVGYLALRLKESPQFVHLKHARELMAAGQRDAATTYAQEHGVDLVENHAPLAEAFKGESLRATAVIGTAFLLNWMGVLSFVILGTSLLTAEDGKNIEFSNALLILAVSNATAFAGYLVHGWLGDRIGRRNTIALGWFFAAVSFAGMLAVPEGSTGPVIALYSAGLFFLLGPFAALLFFNGESFPVQTRATGGSIINAAGQVGAVVGGFIITAALAADQSWTQVTFLWGCLPVLLSSVIILLARNVSPDSVRTD